MTPLVRYSANVVLPATTQQYATVIIPELAQSYGVQDGAVVPITGVLTGVPVPGPIFRCITGAKGRIEAGAGITAGSFRLVVLGLDGNWHQASNGLTIAAGTTYYFGFGPGNSVGSFVVTECAPFLGIGFNVGASFAGGNISYIDVIARAQEVDTGFIYGTKLGPLAQ